MSLNNAIKLKQVLLDNANWDKSFPLAEKRLTKCKCTGEKFLFI